MPGDTDDKKRDVIHSNDPSDLRRALREERFKNEKLEWERSEIAKALKDVAEHSEATSSTQAKILEALRGLQDHRAILTSLPFETSTTTPSPGSPGQPRPPGTAAWIMATASDPKTGPILATFVRACVWLCMGLVLLVLALGLRADDLPWLRGQSESEPSPPSLDSSPLER
jgi:hypothetical protein